MTLEFNCRDCGKSSELETEDLNREATCPSCGRNYGLVSEFVDAQKGVRFCGICSCRDLFLQKDFNRKVGCAIAALGAILAPFTKMISLGVAALIDLILYRVLPLITVCYRCGAIYRDVPLNPDHSGFNLGINDTYRNQ